MAARKACGRLHHSGRQGRPDARVCGPPASTGLGWEQISFGRLIVKNVSGRHPEHTDNPA
jgi:hypothetical protein